MGSIIAPLRGSGHIICPAYETEKENHSASQAGRCACLSAIFRRAHVYAAALRSSSRGTRYRTHWHSIRRRDHVPAGTAIWAAQHSRAVSHDPSVEPGAEGKPFRKVADRRLRRSLNQSAVDRRHVRAHHETTSGGYG